MEIFLHIGYPKCFSTTLQRGYFSKHEEIYYGGVGINTNIDYANENLNIIFESGIPYFKKSIFDKNYEKFKKHINNFIENAYKKNYKAVGFSSEHLLFNFTPQSQDYQIKLNRIKKIFPENTKIIVILREQFSLIRSLYKEYVKMGYPYNYNTFINWIYKYQDRNFYDELLYDEVINNLFVNFGKANLKIIHFEDYKMKNSFNGKRLIWDLNDFLNIKKCDKINLTNYNPSLSLKVLENKRRLNNKLNHNLGNTLLEGFEDHRRRKFYNSYLNLDLSEKILFENVKIKRISLEISKETNNPICKNFFKCDKNLRKIMLNEFNIANKKLNKIKNKNK